MASGETSHVYKEDDILDERLLNQTSKWVLYHRLPSLARHLGISDAEISRIMIPSRTPEEQCFQVRFLRALLDKVGCVVIGDFQMDQCHIMLKDDHTRPYMYGHKNEVGLAQNISIVSYCVEQGRFMLHFTTFHNVSIYT